MVSWTVPLPPPPRRDVRSQYADDRCSLVGYSWSPGAGTRSGDRAAMYLLLGVAAVVTLHSHEGNVPSPPPPPQLRNSGQW